MKPHDLILRERVDVEGKDAGVIIYSDCRHQEEDHHCPTNLNVKKVYGLTEEEENKISKVMIDCQLDGCDYELALEIR